MALIQCPECGKEISDRAAACIHCGCPVSAMKTEAEKPAVNIAAMPETLKEFFDRSAAAQTVKTAPVKPVPKELPEMKLLPGIITQFVEKACGMAGCAGFLALLAVLVDLLRGYGLEPEGLGIAALGMGGGYLLALLLQAMRFQHAKRFLQKNGYEDSIRYDTPSLINSMNAYGLYGSRAMARYIKRLNPVAGNELEAAMKSMRDKKRKEYLGYLPYLAVLAVIFVLIFHFDWMLPSETMCLIIMHLATLAVLGVYGYKKGIALWLVVAAAALFALALYANYMEELWYHILICAVAAFAGMCIGIKMRKK